VTRSPGRQVVRSSGTVSLERALSKLGLASRTQARALIREGRVRVDGRIARDPGRPVVPERIALTIDGAPAATAPPLTIAFHKPRGVVTTRSDPEGRKTVYDLLTDVPARVVPVGRLDLATSGLLLLTNDTRLADWLTDPRNAVPRVYLVTVRGRVAPETMKTLTAGVSSRGEMLAAAAVELRKASSRESHLVVTLEEGRNREVRRLFEAVGHEVARLRRVQFGGIGIGDLAPGAWRTVDERELHRAFPRLRACASG
jgi:23S rRNA pseudouridine2605 synthase